MTAITLDRVLTDAERLPSDEQEILEGLLRKRRIEAWRSETAAYIGQHSERLHAASKCAVWFYGLRPARPRYSTPLLKFPLR